MIEIFFQRDDDFALLNCAFLTKQDSAVCLRASSRCGFHTLTIAADFICVEKKFTLFRGVQKVRAVLAGTLCVDADACLAIGLLVATDQEGERNIQSQRSDLYILSKVFL
jgi:hypothetical protein